MKPSQICPPIANSVYAIVENVRSLHNVGAIFRTADGAGVSQIILTGITGRPPHREIRKVALGAEENIPWKYVPESTEAIARLKSENFQIIALETTPGSLPYDQVEYRFPLCLVVGHEYHGVTQDALQMSDMVINLPMHGSKVSLNVAVAFGIAMYEIVKRRPDSTPVNV